ncbi:interferon-induced protein 44-like [Halichoeres trimaculatus]|uniref:interferon-induced protein 44-like n=1 Tax=Halichoeres trimaculatus TaxID=147232 RepID=UPI003D9F0E91
MNTYTTYKVQKKGTGKFYPFVFNDIMGLSSDRGVLVDDIKLALEGHVKEGYKFNPESKLSEGDQNYVRSPTDKVHVLVCVIPADTLPVIPETTLQKIRDVRGAASELGIPQVVILTKIDEVQPEIKKNLRDVYRAHFLKTMMEKFSADVGIPMNCIFPVKNYHEEVHLNNDIDSLLLNSLENLINFGDDCISFRRIQAEG